MPGLRRTSAMIYLSGSVANHDDIEIHHDFMHQHT